MLITVYSYRSRIWQLSLGVNFMEKTISVRRTTITFSIWDLGGMFSPHVCRCRTLAQLIIVLLPHLSTRSERVRQHVTIGVQRRSGYLIHVRPHAKVHSQLGQGVV